MSSNKLKSLKHRRIILELYHNIIYFYTYGFLKVTNFHMHLLYLNMNHSIIVLIQVYEIEKYILHMKCKNVKSIAITSILCLMHKYSTKSIKSNGLTHFKRVVLFMRSMSFRYFLWCIPAFGVTMSMRRQSTQGCVEYIFATFIKINVQITFCMHDCCDSY